MSNITLSNLAPLIDQIQTRSHEWLAPDSVLSLPPQQVMRKWSLMLRIPSRTRSGEGNTLLVKITRHQGGGIEDAIMDGSLVQRTIREYEMLRSVERIFSMDAKKQSFCFVRPLAVLEEWNALVTEELDCKPLKDHLLNIPMLMGSSQHWETFTRLLERSARWLRNYHHGMGSQGFDAFQHLGLRMKLEEHLRQLSSVLADGEADRVRRAVDSIFDEQPNTLVPIAVLHGDFHCSNLLVTPDLRVGSLDADCVQGPIYEDIAKLLVDLETRSLQVFTFGLLITPGRLKHCRQVVLNGYFNSTDADHILLEFFMVLAVLCKWRIDEDLLVHSTGAQRAIRKLLSPARRWYMLRILKLHLENLVLQTKAQQQKGSPSV